MGKLFKDLSKEENVGHYVCVNVMNYQQLAEWYSKQGLKTIDPTELHCTIAYSRRLFQRTPNPLDIVVSDVYPQLEILGDEGCVVLKLKSKELENRFNECIEAGATYDYENYIPHITIAVNVTEDISKYKSPDFDIILGLESISKLIKDFTYEK